MPVITRPSPQKTGRSSEETIDPVNLSLPLLRVTTRECESPYESDSRKPQGAKPTLLSSSFDNYKGQSPIIPYENGFVNGIIRAFNQDLHLVLRPEDLWLSILLQLGFYVNGNAEMVRRYFVSHEGKKDLIVDLTPIPLSNIPIGSLAQEMASVIQENVIDEGLKDWMIPNFTTTTDTDKSIASFVMMGTLKIYFDVYFLAGGCGFPSVTLLGERSDWEEILQRIEKLPLYGSEPADWAKLLQPVIRYMLLTFDRPDSREVKDFWLRAVHEAGVQGSHGGLRTLSGWITAFAFWKENGERVYAYSDDKVRECERTRWGEDLPPVDRKRLVLDGVTYPLIKPASIPKGVITLPVTIRDMDKMADRHATVLAGSVGMSLSGEGTTVQPLSGWWVTEEFQTPIGANGPAIRVPGVSVTGSTTEDTTGASSIKCDDREDEDDFDDSFLP